MRILALAVAFFGQILWAADPMPIADFFRASQTGQKALGSRELSPAAMELLKEAKGRTLLVSEGKALTLRILPRDASEKEVVVVVSAVAGNAEVEKAILKAFGKEADPQRIEEGNKERPAKLDLGEKVMGRFSQRNQGRLGTCHAFSNIPLIEAMENRFNGKKGLPFRASENWMVFASTLDKLCSAKREEVRQGTGWLPDDDLKRLLSLGYCEEKFYLPYDGKDGEKGVKSPGGAPSEEKAAVAPSEGDALVSEATALAKNSKFMKGEITNEVFAAKFKKSFGIDWKLAKDKLCDPTKDNVDALLKSDDVAKEFKMCLKMSREKAAWLKEASCAVNNKNYKMDKKLPAEEAKERTDRIKDALAKDLPVYISMRDYLPDLDPEKKHTYHALAITGYDDSKSEFKTLNSWGAGANAAVPYGRAGEIYQIGFLACTGITATPGTKGLGTHSGPEASGAEGK